MFFRRRVARARPRRLLWDRIDKLFEVQLQLLELEDRTVPATFTVTTTSDDGAGSLRQAILDANAALGADSIEFGIGSGSQTIQPATALPSITEAVTIDATTQPGFVGVPIIELDGSIAGAGASGLALLANNSVIQGFVINGFSAAGIRISGPSATGNAIRLNFIGTNLLGTTAVPNALGIMIEGGATNNSVGGGTASERNVLSGNVGSGILITGLSTSGNTVAGNSIGTNATWTAAIANGQYGVHVVNSTGANTIGGTDVGSGNVISGNGFTGLFLENASNQVVQGNKVGTNASGTAAVPNLYDGIAFYLTGAHDNLIGGTVAGAGNLISGNLRHGIYFESANGDPQFNVVQGNRIGTNADGTAALGNGTSGIQIRGGLSNNLIGGSTTGAGNLISGNGSFGAFDSGISDNGSGTVIQGNFIGTDVTGSVALGNKGAGVFTGPNAVLGGSWAAGEGNLISGNARQGVYMGNSVVRGNRIGTDVTGSFRLANDVGVELGSGTLGGPLPEDRNIISGNGRYGVYLYGNAVIQGNTIGLNAAGDAAVPNSSIGVVVNNLGGNYRILDNVVSGNIQGGISAGWTLGDNVVIAGNLIGLNLAGTAAVGNGGSGLNFNSQNGLATPATLLIGSDGNGINDAAERNVIAGNAGAGIYYVHSDAAFSHNLVVAGNFIGTNKTGTAAVPNLGNGIYVATKSGSVILGGATTGTGNVIGGNAAAGIHLTRPETSGVVVLGNLIGTDVTGSASLGNSTGVLIDGGAHGNTVGGAMPGEGNVIGGNRDFGIRIEGSGTNSNAIRGNFIGTNADGSAANANGFNALGQGNSVESNAAIGIFGGASNNTVGGQQPGERNVISGNDWIGVAIGGSGTDGNIVEGNWIGLTASGTAAIGNDRSGVLVGAGASNTRIGGTATVQRNVIGGNGFGVTVWGAGAGNRIEGNFIGTNALGTASLGSIQLAGVYLLDTAGVAVGGTSAGAGNLISGNTDGIWITGSLSTGNAVLGNFIGTNGTGSSSIANGNGIRIDGNANGNTIGGPTNGSRNVISGNAQSGITIGGTGTSGNRVQGNFIGTNVSGSVPVANGASGVALGGGASGNFIGTDGDGTNDAAEGNVIGGNGQFGVSLNGPGTTFNVVAGNIVGLNAAGTSAVANGFEGIFIGGGATKNRVGTNGDGMGDAAERNVIGGNLRDGVEVDGGTTDNNVIAGNYIGLNAAGTAKVGNAGYGVIIGFGPVGNRVGTDGSNDAFNASERNVISGNGLHNIGIFGNGTANTVIAGNYIGLTASGTAAVVNPGIGILVNSLSNNTRIGTDGNGIADLEERNVIGGHTSDGIIFESASVNGHVVAGNYIGTNAAGTAALPNRAGVRIRNGARLIRVGTDGSNDTFNASERNLISGNSQNGIVLDNANSGFASRIAGNIIGLAADGATKLPNFNGIQLINSSSNVVIGSDGNGIADDLERNIISGNNWQGIEVNTNTHSNTIAGNYIGLNVAGTAAVANAQFGVWVGNGANRLTLGGTTAAQRNVISGNTVGGVALTGSSSFPNTVLGNFIGTNAAGTAALGNGGHGVQINAGAANHTIGGTSAGARNVISGNSLSGVLVADAGSNNNAVAGNYIGINAAGDAAIANGNWGVVVYAGATNTRVGTNGDGSADTTERNVISGNKYDGVGIGDSTTIGTVIAGNFIGTNAGGTAALANLGSGVLIVNGSNKTRIGTDGNGVADGAERNVIAGNVGNGVIIGSSSTNNTVAGNYIGLNAAGDVKLANGSDGVRIESGASSNIVGGSIAAAGNIISGNTRYGVLVNGITSNSNVILGNRVGTNAAGTAALMNEVGIRLEGSSDTVIGGGVAGAGNLVSGNRLWGIELLDSVRAVVAGNLVGLNAAGNAAVPNIHGIIVNVNAADSRVGTDADGINDIGERNVFAGNSGNNVLVQLGAKRSAIAGNYIGTDPTGTVGIFGTPAALVVAGAVTDTRIGTNGDGVNDAVEANIIAAGLYEGILIHGDGTDRTVVAGNRIGVGANGVAIPNGTAIHIRFGPADTRIGTDGNGVGDAAERNVIAGNNGWGIIVQTPEWNGTLPAAGVFTERTTIAGNFIGTNLDATAAMGNAGGGVLVQLGATLVRIGTDGNGVADGAERNIISGNASFGIQIYQNGNSGVTVAGNSIGTNLASSGAVANQSNGIYINGGSANNIIGTNGDGKNDVIEGNLISGNAAHGVVIQGSGNDFNRIAGNFIGVNSNGSAKLDNKYYGVLLTEGAKFNVIGTNGDGQGDADERNVISGNYAGVVLGTSNGRGADTDFNVIAGNYIGTDATGKVGLGNQYHGIQIAFGASYNLVGTNADGISDDLERNILSGNNWCGIAYGSIGTEQNVLAGNYIGTDLTGNFAIPNLLAAVIIGDGATKNRVGTNSDGKYDQVERNVISGNAMEGVLIQVAGTSENIVAGNYIGTKADGLSSLSNAAGISIALGASKNIIGGTAAGAGNVIGGNIGSGVTISGTGTSDNRVLGNSIGTNAAGNAAIGDQDYGIELRDGASNNIIGAPLSSNDANATNTVAHNNVGIAIASTAGAGNIVRLNQLYSNATANLANGLGTPTAPTIGLAVANFGVTRVVGSLAGVPGATVTLDFYEAQPGETAARRLIGTAVVVLNGAGTADYDLRLPGNANPGNEIVVTASTATSGTSEFGGPRTALAPINIGVLAPTVSPEGTEVTLSARVSSDRQNAVFTFEWAVVRVGSPGTVASGTDNSLNFTPTDDGDYRATLTVRDITNNESVLFTVPDIAVTNASPFAAMIDRATNRPVGDASLPTGGVLRLRGVFTDPGLADTHAEAWYINGGGAPVATGPNFDFSTMTAGRYIVTYRVTDNGGAVGEYAVSVTVRGAIGATISGLPSQSLEGVRLTAAALLDGLLNPTTLQYRWNVTKDGVDFGAIASTPTAQNSEFSFTPDDNASYVVTLTVTDPETGASATDSKSVAILNVAPTVRLNATGGAPALGQPIAFAAVATDPGTNATHDDKLNYDWSVVGPVGFKTPGGNDPGYSFLPTVAGIYFVTVSIGDKDGGRSADSQMMELFAGSRTVEVAGLPSGAVGEGTTLNLSASTAAPGVAFTYEWSAIRSGVELATGSDPTFNLPLRQQGIYTVLVTATGSDGSIGTASHEIVALNTAPTVSIAPTPFSAPEGTTVNFVGIASDPAGSDDALKYSWSVTGPGLNIPDAGTGREFPFVIPNNVAYEVSLTVTDPSNLTATASRTIVGKNIAPSVTILNDGTTAGRIAVKAVANEPGLVDISTLSFQWFVDGLPVAGATGPSFASTAGGRISVEVSDGDETTAAVVEIFLATGTAPFVVPAPAPSTTQVLVIGDADNNTIDARNLTVPAVLDGGDGDDTIYGGSGDDILFAGGGEANLLVGGEGNNAFYAGTGDDTMIGGTGDDTYYLTFSQDAIVDTGGYDTLDASSVTYGITLNLTLAGPQIVAGTSSLDLAGNFELLIGTSHADRLYAGAGDEIDGGAGADSLFALAANVTLYGGDGNDDDSFLAEPGAAKSVLIGGGGSDRFVALAPSVTLYGGDGNDDFALSGDAVGSLVQGGTGRDVATSAASNVTLYGGEGDDDFTVTNGSNAVVAGGDGDVGTGGPTLAANSGNDKLSVLLGSAVTLYGGDGDDTAFVGGGTDIVANGNAGNDTLVGLGTGVSLSGDGGADTLVALAGSGITLYGGDDDDFLVAGGGTGTAIVGGDGNDKLVAANVGGRITLYGGDGEDEFAINPVSPTVVPDGEGGTVALAPTFGTDIFADGGADNDFLTVSAGSAITLYGGDGDDFALATGGTDIVLAGGGMNDIAVAAAAGASVTLYGGDGDDALIANPDQPIVLPTVRGPVAIPAASALAVTLYGGEGDDELIVAGGSNVVASGNGGQNSFVLAGGTAITLYGGDGDDDFAVAAPGSAVSLPGGSTYPAALSSTVAIAGGSGQNGYAIAGGSAITLYGGDGDEDFAITGGENVAVVGALGQDKMTVAGTASGVTLYGGDNDDDVLVAGGTDVQVDGNTGNDEVLVSGGKGVVVRGLEGRDTIATTGGLGVTLYGGDGDDELFASNFADAPVLVGGDGNDRLVANSDVAITLYGGDADEFVVRPLEDAKNVLLVGNQGIDRLIVQGGTGITLYGGDGDDGLILDSGSGIAVDGGTGADTFVVRSVGGGVTLFGGDGDDDFQIAGGTELVVHGNDGDDSIAVAGGNGWFYGDAGTDRLAAGRSTAVTLFGGSGDERIVAAGGAVAANLYGGDGDDELFAVAGNSNVLVGNDGKDRLVAVATDNVTLYGLAGDDVFEILGGTNVTALGDLGIYGYTGTDTFTVSGGANVNVYGERSSDIIAITGGVGVSAFGGSGNDLLSATGGNNVLLAGNADNDLIQGNSTAGILAFGGTGDDILATGGKGADILVGEEGNDRYQFSNPLGDVVLTLDEVRRLGDDEPFRDSYGHGSDVLDLRFLGSGVALDLSRVAGKVATAADRQTIMAGLNIVLFGVFDQVWGTPFADSIVGNDANNTFLGLGGNDTLVAGAGNDTLVGGDGDNALEGGDGSDTFRFQYATALSAGTDTISDNAADTDTLDFAPLTPANAPALISSGLTVDLGFGSVQTVGGGRNFVIVGGTGIEGATGTNFSDTLVGTAADDSLVGGGGDDLLVGGLGSDTLSGGAGDNSLNGGEGDDWYELAPAGIDRIVDTGGYDSAEFSQAHRGVTFTLQLDGGQLQTVDEAGNRVSITGTLERLMGSSFDDILTGNAVANEIIGRNGLDILNGVGGDDFVEGGYTQLVLLDFDSETRSGEYVYSAALRTALLDRFNALFAPFGIQFVSLTATAQAESARYGGRYTVLRFNSGAPGGVSSEIDPRNVNLGGLTQVNAFDYLSKYLPDHLAPSLVDGAMLELSFAIGAHELGHLLGLRHADAFGPIGSGIHVGGSLTPESFRPPSDAGWYLPAAGAAETGRHVMASPLSLGIDAAQSLARPYFGEREALKLAFAQYGSTVGEQVAPHRTAATAMPLNFRPIIVPNTLQAGDQFYGSTFSVFAVAVGGSIELDGGGKSENDYYVFGGRAGEMFTFELSSRTAGRFAGRQIDGILRLYDSGGNLLAANDDDFESQDAILIDVKLPADGTYYLVVDTFADGTDTDTGLYELMAYRMGVGSEVGRGDTLIGSSGSDTLRGSNGPDVIQITASASANTIETSSRIAIVDITQNPSYDLGNIVGDPIVVGANGEPVFTVAPPTASVDETSYLQLQFTAVDPDSGGVIYDLVNAPPGATIDATTGTFRWLPTDSGTFTFAVRATDFAGVSTTTDVTVTVDGVAPTVSLTGVPTTSSEGAALHFGTVVADVSPADRAAGYTYHWTVTDLDNNITVSTGNGTALSFTPNDNGQFRVGVAVSDKDGEMTVVSADFAVTNVAPSVALTADAATVAEGSTATFTATATDPSTVDTAALVYVWTVNGSTKLSGFGLANFTHVPAANGMDVVAVTVIDPDGDSSTAEFALPVTNVAPTISSFTVTTLEANRAEGSPLTATVTFTDPGRVGNGGTETYRLTWSVTGSNGQSESFVCVVDGSSPVVFSFAPTDDGNYDIAVSVTENNADAATTEQLLAAIAVANVAPTVAFAGPTSGLINDALTFTLTTSDAGPSDRAANFTFQIDWNDDGIVDQTLVAPSDTAVTHAFATAGLHTVRVKATDKDGAAGSPVTIVVEVIPAENKLNVLTIYGTNKSDDIRVRMTNAGLVWELNKSRFGPILGIDKIAIFGLNGNDDIRVEGSVTIPAEIHGDAGNDTLRSGAGNDTLSGGTGDDELIATTGNDVLYGDAGDDTLRAGTGQDTLYGGEGDDDLRADRGNDVLYGDAGEDTLRGGEGSDSLSGGAGNDDIRGGSGNDVIDGGTGFLDTLDGGDGNDTITDPDGAVDVDGGSDADSIALVFLAPPAGVSLSRATVEGGSGNDAISISSSRSSLRLDLDGESGDDTFDLSGTWQFIDLQGGSGRDTLRRYGSTGAVVLHGIEVDLR